MGGRKYRWLSLLGIVVMGCLGACTPVQPNQEHNHGDGGQQQISPETASSRPTKDYAKIQMTADDGCKVEYKFDQGAEWPIREDHFTMTVEVWTKDGSADKDFAIEVDADMPEHGHGMNSTAKIEPVDGAKNKFKVSGMLFHMRGWWQIYVKVTKGCGPSMATFNSFVE